MSTYSNQLQPAHQNLLQHVVWFFHSRSTTTHILADVQRITLNVSCCAWRSRVKEPNNSIYSAMSLALRVIFSVSYMWNLFCSFTEPFNFSTRVYMQIFNFCDGHMITFLHPSGAQICQMPGHSLSRLAKGTPSDSRLSISTIGLG